MQYFHVLIAAETTAQIVAVCLRFAYKPDGTHRDLPGLSNTTRARNPDRTGFIGTDRD